MYFTVMSQTKDTALKVVEVTVCFEQMKVSYLTEIVVPLLILSLQNKNETKLI